MNAFFLFFPSSWNWLSFLILSLKMFLNYSFSNFIFLNFKNTSFLLNAKQKFSYSSCLYGLHHFVDLLLLLSLTLLSSMSNLVNFLSSFFAKMSLMSKLFKICISLNYVIKKLLQSTDVNREKREQENNFLVF